MTIFRLSTIANWEAEFKKWVPDVNIIVYMGDSKSRAVIQEHEFYGQVQNVDDDSLDKKRLKFNVLLTTYEFVIKDSTFYTFYNIFSKTNL
jgi:chromodomain-helicase-DNA-binding protein 1